MTAEPDEHTVIEVEAAGPPPGRAITIVATLLGLGWIATAGLAAYHYLGVERLLALDPVAGVMLGAVAILPVLMVWLAAAAAVEGAKARREAKRLADAAAGLLNPAAHSESAARRLAVAVRGEISALDRALEQTVARLKEVEGSVSRQTHAVNSVASKAKESAEHMISGLENERDMLLRIADDLNSQAALIGQHISSHTHHIAEAARLAEAEVRAADIALEERLSSFGAAAALITDRTQELTGAAAASADSALRLETALSSALETLAKATTLTDAARQSAEAATLAANSTAGAVRDTTARAIEEAKRAADLIRGEAAAVEREAGAALNKLRDAAEGARGAARAARSAVEPEAQKPAERRPITSFQRGPADVRPQAKPQPVEQRTPPPPKKDNPFAEPGDSPLHPAAPANNGGAWTWRELLSSIDDEDSAPQTRMPERQRAVRREAADDPIARLTQAVTEQRGAHPIAAVHVIEQAGVAIGEVFTAATLDRIAHRARNGSQARRKAVKDAVGPAIRRLKEHLRQNDAARAETADFLRSDGARIAELLARGRASMSADATRAFLLLDAAES